MILFCFDPGGKSERFLSLKTDQNLTDLIVRSHYSCFVTKMSDNTTISIDQVKEKLKAYFNYDSFKSDEQQRAIMSILNGKFVTFSDFLTDFYIS